MDLDSRENHQMFQIERQNNILEYINSAHKATTNELAEKFNVSKVTIRRDIDTIAEQGLIAKTDGGAVALTNGSLHEIPYSVKSEHNQSAKKKIGKTAASLIEDGDIIILDSGSTTLEIAKNITQKNITVVTNDIKIAMELSGKPNIKLMVCGGTLINPVYTLTGLATIDFFSTLHVNKTFLGCDAMDLEFGISNRTYEEVNIKRAMMKAGDVNIMCADDSKLDKKVFCHLSGFEVLDIIIINRIDERYKKMFEDKNVKVILTD